MRVLVTGHMDIWAVVLTPLLTAAGHEVTGLDTGSYADCLLGPAAGAAARPWQSTYATSDPEHCAGFDAVVPSRRALQRSDRQPGPRN